MDKGEGLVFNSSSPKLGALCDEIGSIAIDNGQPPDGSQELNPDSSGRQRHNSFCSPSRKRPDKRRRSRSLQLNKFKDLQFEENPPQKKFVSMAEGIYKFHKSTPERFHTKPVIDGSQRWQAGQINPSYKKLRCTVPQSPNVTSHLHARPVTYPSKQEREEAELQQMQKSQELNPDSSGRQRHNSFCSPSRKRPDKRRRSRSLQLKKVSGAVSNKEMEQKGVKKAIPIKRVTVPLPFTFEERDKIRQKQKEEKIRQVFEEEKRVREFHANPIPKSVKCSTCPLELKSLTPTQPEPFHLHTEERRLQHEEALKAKLEEERRAAEATRFKARPPVVLTKKPFEPVKPQRVLTEITNICLNTEIQSKERERFEMKMKEKETLLEERRRLLKEREEREEEEEERARLRREAIHKAQPISKYAPVVVAKSTKELTIPESPFSRTKTSKQ